MLHIPYLCIKLLTLSEKRIAIALHLCNFCTERTDQNLQTKTFTVVSQFEYKTIYLSVSKPTDQIFHFDEIPTLIQRHFFNRKKNTKKSSFFSTQILYCMTNCIELKNISFNYITRKTRILKNPQEYKLK